jgi:hypothetical protein
VELNTLLVADYANIAEGGKPNVMGIFRNITAPKFPVRHPEMFLIMGMSVSPGEYGKKRNLTVRLINADATAELANFTHDFTVPASNAGHKSEINHIIRLQDIVFPAPGTYQFSVLVDDDEKGAMAIELSGLQQS